MLARLFLLFVFIMPFAADAHHSNVFCDEEIVDDGGVKVSADRAKWYKEAREMKHRFLAKELELKKEQQKQFFDLYDNMEDETSKVQRDTRMMEKRVYDLGDKATELDYEKATEALYECKEKEAAIEKKYQAEYKKILTPRQMFRLKGAERKFTRELMDRHQKLKKEKK